MHQYRSSSSTPSGDQHGVFFPSVNMDYDYDFPTSFTPLQWDVFQSVHNDSFMMEMLNKTGYYIGNTFYN